MAEFDIDTSMETLLDAMDTAILAKQKILDAYRTAAERDTQYVKHDMREKSIRFWIARKVGL